MLIRFLFYLPCWFIGTFILPWPLVPIAVLLADKDGRLPKGLRWLETHDDLGFGALDQEPAVEAFAKKWGKRIGLIRWLWRNKAYTLRYRMGIPMHTEKVSWRVVRQYGDRPKRKGLSALWVSVEANGKRYFEFQPSLSFGSKGRVYFRIGWKLEPFIRNPNPSGSTGMFTGITPRLDDYDD